MQPLLNEFKSIDFIKPQFKRLNKNATLYFSKTVPNNTSRIELYFDAGRIRGRTGLAAITGGLLFSGSKNQNAIQIQKSFDKLGAFKDISVSQEECVISIYALNSKLPEVFDVLYRALNEVVFLQGELDEFLSHKKQSFEINSQKVGFLAGRKFVKEIYNGSVYGKVVEIENIENTSREELMGFHDKYFLNGLLKATLVGNVNEDKIDLIAQKLKKWTSKNDCIFEQGGINNPGVFYEKKENAMQSAIKIGKKLFNRNDPQFMDFFILNTVLGGYFGSRLMSNLREEKGYTYGIGSSVSELHKSGLFIVSTEVGKEYLDDSIVQIKKEFDLLCTDLISLEELELVKNYLQGQLLKSADGAYAMMSLYVSLQKHGLTFDFYTKYVERLFSINPVNLRDSAQQHLLWDQMTVVYSG